MKGGKKAPGGRRQGQSFHDCPRAYSVRDTLTEVLPAWAVNIKIAGGHTHKEKTMKKRHGVFFGFAVLMITAIFTAAGCDTSGSDDDDDIIKISTAEQFNEIRNNLGGHYVLEADINLASYANFVPIGRFEPVSEQDADDPKLELAFTGVFDGNGHKISNVIINAPETAGVGLFGCIAGDVGTIKNLVVENVTVTGMMLVGGVIGYGATTNTIENITLQGENNITGEVGMLGGIIGGGSCGIRNCNARADVVLNGDGAQGIGILAGGMEDGSIISCTVTGGSITVTGTACYSIGALAACAEAPEVKDCTVKNVIITVGENCFMIGGLLGHAGTCSPDTPTAINNCTVSNVTINTPTSAERIGGIIGSGFYYSVYASYPKRGAPNAFTVTNSTSSGSIIGGCIDLVGKIAGYIYDNSTVDGTCTSTMTGVANNVGGNKETAALATLK
jgi:hypothetical protein